MSVVQRRAKNICQIPLIDMKENETELPFNDPRSPSANVTRTPVDLNTHHIPNDVPATKTIPTNSTR